MPVQRSLRALLALCPLAGAVSTAQAASFTFEGDIRFHNDVVRIDFTLAADATNVRVWTDSFNTGANFDPITAVWSLPSGAKVGENDDDDTIAPGQTYYDSGLVFASLAAGQYAFTITPFANFAPANLFDTFPYANEAPIAIGAWCQPASDNCLDQKGTYWRVRLEGVDGAVNVPEPQTYALMLLGLAGVLRVASRQSARTA